MKALIKYDAACKALAAAKRVDEAKGIRDQAEALRVYARQAKNRDLEIDAAEIRIRAERRVGELIEAQKRTVGLAKGGNLYRRGTSAKPVQVERPPTLEEVGIDRKLSAHAQKLAAIPPAKFERRIKDWRADASDGGGVAVDLLAAEERAKRVAARNEKIIRSAAFDRPLPERKFAIWYADPPWPYEMGFGDRSPENHYAAMSLEQICALPVRDRATPVAALFLWIPEPHLFCSGPKVLDAWGFTHKTGLVWDKEIIGTGHVVRGQHEHLLYCTRGDFPNPLPHNRPRSVHTERRRAHSVKPDWFAAQIERMYPQFHRLPPAEPMMIELFARRARPGWAVWGDQAPLPSGPDIFAPSTLEHEGKILRWLKAVGDTVAKGDVLAEIETHSAIIEVEAIDSGVLINIAAPAGATGILGGDLIGVLGLPVAEAAE